LKLINSCQIVFIASSEASRLPEVLTYTEGHPILTIGDTDGFASKGALINFYPSGEYVRFEVNSLAIQRSKLKFSSRLLKLARFVDDLRGSNASSQ
jgi:YfiR/HmsC-like